MTRAERVRLARALASVVSPLRNLVVTAGCKVYCRLPAASLPEADDIYVNPDRAWLGPTGHPAYLLHNPERSEL